MFKLTLVVHATVIYGIQIISYTDIHVYRFPIDNNAQEKQTPISLYL